jgi:hypothetical protein
MFKKTVPYALAEIQGYHKLVLEVADKEAKSIAHEVLSFMLSENAEYLKAKRGKR